MRKISLVEIYKKLLLKESMFGNGIYEGKKILIPDDLAIWCMDFYSVQNYGLYDYNKIPIEIINASKKLVRSYGNNVIYRGFGVNGEINSDITFDTKNGISWTFDEDTARAFAETAENGGLRPYIAELEYSKVKHLISMDVIIDNITQEQLNILDNEVTSREIQNYTSESEILVFDTVTVNKDNIMSLWEN